MWSDGYKCLCIPRLGSYLFPARPGHHQPAVSLWLRNLKYALHTLWVCADTIALVWWQMESHYSDLIYHICILELLNGCTKNLQYMWVWDSRLPLMFCSIWSFRAELLCLFVLSFIESLLKICVHITILILGSFIWGYTCASWFACLLCNMQYLVYCGYLIIRPPSIIQLG